MSSLGSLANNVKIVNNDEYKKKYLTNQSMNDFVVKNSKFIERALGEKDLFDMLKAYDNDNTDIDNKYFSKDILSNPIEFFDDNLCYKRSVINLDWSIKHSELLLSAYSKSEESNTNDPNGLIMLWSMALRKKPEFVFTCPTEITSATFHKFNPKIVIGATYTGQILIWDTRGKSLPVDKTPPGGKFHSHPIYCLGVNGSPNSSNIVSVSNDGMLCSWSMLNLSKATKRIELKVKSKKAFENDLDTLKKNVSNSYLEEIGAICMAIQENDTNNVMIGGDDSDIYQIYAHQG